MTALNERLKNKICTFCGNCQGGCLADVPYYAVSINCKYFKETSPQVPVKRKRFDLKKILVETI
jgi:hypothetical protein